MHTRHARPATRTVPTRSPAKTTSPKPWSNAQIKLLQLSFNPTAAIDSEFWNLNKLSDVDANWPTAAAQVEVGQDARTVTLFNDTFKGEQCRSPGVFDRDRPLAPSWTAASSRPMFPLAEQEAACGHRRPRHHRAALPRTQGGEGRTWNRLPRLLDQTAGHQGVAGVRTPPDRHPLWSRQERKGWRVLGSATPCPAVSR